MSTDKPCQKCASKKESSLKILIACAECRLVWHHQCHSPPLPHGIMLAMMKADAANDVDNGTYAWVCSACIKQKQTLVARQRSSTTQTPPNTTTAPSVIGSSSHMGVDDPMEKTPDIVKSTNKANDQKFPVQVSHLPSHDLSSGILRPNISPGQYSTTPGSDSIPEISSWQNYISPIAHIRREGINPSKNDFLSTTITRASPAQQDSRTSTPASSQLFNQRADSLTRRMSHLDVTMDDHDITPVRKSNAEEKEAGLLRTLLHEEVENDILGKSFSPRHRPPLTKFKAKRFERESRKGIERVNGFANFYFFPSENGEYVNSLERV